MKKFVRKYYGWMIGGASSLLPELVKKFPKNELAITLVPMIYLLIITENIKGE